MDSDVKTIMDATSCTETEAQSALEETGGDVKKALKMLDAGAKQVMVFQLNFKGNTAEKQGFLTAMFDTSSSDVLHTDLVYPMPQDKAAMLNVNMPPTIFASTVKNIRQGFSDKMQGACRSNASQMKSKFSSNFIQTTVSMHNQGQKDTVAERFKKILDKILGESYTVLYSANAYSMESLSSMLGGGKSRKSNSPESKAASLFGRDDEPPLPTIDIDDLPSASPQEDLPRIMLICEPEISPFEGTSARNLQEGDEVIVKIKDGREAARYFAELLGGLVNDELVPLAVPVIKFTSASDSFVEAYVEFGPGIYGQFFIPPDVKIKMADEENLELYDPFQNEESLFADSRMGRKIFIELGLLIVATITLIIIFWRLGLG